LKNRRGDFQSTGELPDISQYIFEQNEFEDSEALEGEQYYSEPQYTAQPPKRKKRRGLRVFTVLLVLVLIAAAAFAALMLLGKRPAGAADDCFTVLLAGTDSEGYRTDTLLLAGVKPSDGKISIMSIPRDTYISNSGYYVPKINSAYGWVGGGEEGIKELMECVQQLTGIYPDAYVMIDIAVFEAVVDKMGGVEFDVPQDMYYEDPYQDLVIDLKAGLQQLDGEEAMGLVRFRSGYAMADLRRVEVQRDFMRAAAKQWLVPSKLTKLPGVVTMVLDEMDTDLTKSNLLWLGRTLLGCDMNNIESCTLPGTPGDINGGSYYIPDAEKTANMCGMMF